MNDASGALDTKWTQMASEEKLAHRQDRWLNPSIEFASEAAEQAYKSRVGRIIDAICLEKTPDRVPVPLQLTEVYPLRWAGFTPYDGMYDFRRAGQAFIDFTLEFHPDALVSPLAATMPGRAFEKVGYELYSWPGHGAPQEALHQYNEKEWMLASDYDDFITDPSDFLLRRFTPRVCTGLQGLSRLGTSLDIPIMAFSSGYYASWADPQLRESLQNLIAAGEEAAAWFEGFVGVVGQLQAQGFPAYVSGATQAPFDYLGDHMRGTKNIFMDLYRRPEKVLEACERLVPLMIRWVVEKTTPDSSPVLFWPLHKGADGFMSLEQFETFYWPTMRKVMLGLIDEGFIPLCFAEGRYGSRLESLARDLPKGKTVWLFDQTDMTRAKEVLGDIAAIQGNVPLSLLRAGTPEEVREYCRKLIEVAAPGGGFLLDSGAAVYEAEAENMRAMIQAAKDFGTY